MLLEQLVLLFLDRAFSRTVQADRPRRFQILRDSEMEIDEEAEDLVRTFESALKRRRRGSDLIGGQYRYGARPAGFLYQLHVSNDDVFVLEGLIGLSDTKQLIVEERPDLVFPPYNARFPERIRDFGGDCSRRSATRTSSSTIPTRASTWWCSSCGRRRAIRVSSRSSRRSTGPARTHPS